MWISPTRPGTHKAKAAAVTDAHCIYQKRACQLNFASISCGDMGDLPVLKTTHRFFGAFVSKWLDVSIPICMVCL